MSPNQSELPAGLTPVLEMFADIRSRFQPKLKTVDAYITVTRSVDGFDYSLRLCVMCLFDPIKGFGGGIKASVYGAVTEIVLAKDRNAIVFENGQIVLIDKEEQERAVNTFRDGFWQAFGDEEE